MKAMLTWAIGACAVFLLVSVVTGFIVFSATLAGS
jgi:hypothetical protein